MKKTAVIAAFIAAAFILTGTAAVWMARDAAKSRPAETEDLTSSPAWDRSPLFQTAVNPPDGYVFKNAVNSGDEDLPDGAAYANENKRAVMTCMYADAGAEETVEEICGSLRKGEDPVNEVEDEGLRIRYFTAAGYPMNHLYAVFAKETAEGRSTAVLFDYSFLDGEDFSIKNEFPSYHEVYEGLHEEAYSPGSPENMIYYYGAAG